MGISDETRRFTKRFDETESELLILTGAIGQGAGKGGKDVLWTASVGIIAFLDVNSKELVTQKATLKWLATEEDKGRNWIHSFEQLCIYRVLVKKTLQYEDTIEDGAPQILEFMLLEVLKKEENEQLFAVKEAYLKPVILEDEIAHALTLERAFSNFEGAITWMEHDCNLFLDTDEVGCESAKSAIKTFHCLMRNMKIWDDKMKTFAAQELTESANDWQEEAKTQLTQEDFKKRMVIRELSICLEGKFEVYASDDDMFFGHVIIVSGNINAGIEDAYIAG